MCDVEVGFQPALGATASLQKIEPFVVYLGGLLEYWLKISIKAGKGESIEENADFEKKMTLLERKSIQTEKNTKPLFSEEQLWNVLEFFFFSFTEQLTISMKPMAKWFNYTPISNLISKTQSHIGAFHLNSVQRGNPQYFDIVRNAKSMHFIYKMEMPQSPKLIGLLFEININVLFSDTGYTVSCFPDEKFDYWQYPSVSKQNNVIDKYKQDALEKIEKNILN